MKTGRYPIIDNRSKPHLDLLHDEAELAARLAEEVQQGEEEMWER